MLRQLLCGPDRSRELSHGAKTTYLARWILHRDLPGAIAGGWRAPARDGADVYFSHTEFGWGQRGDTYVMVTREAPGEYQ